MSSLTNFSNSFSEGGEPSPVAVTLASSLSSLSEHSVATGTATASGASTPLAVTGIIVQAVSSNSISVYVGGSGVTVGTGIELDPGAIIKFSVVSSDQIFSIAASSGQKLRVIIE